MNAALEATSVPNQNGSTARPGRSFMPHMYMAFWFDMAKAFGKCNLQRSARSRDHFAGTHTYIRPGNWSTLVGLGRIKSHSTSKLNGIGITCHRSHTALTATDSPVNRARIEIQAAKKRKQEPAGGTSVIEMGTTL